MKPNPTIQASAAYGPTLSLVRDALADAQSQPGDLRVLLQKAAALREFDVPLLSRLAGLDNPEPDLVEELRFYVQLEELGDDAFHIEEYSRQALLEIANREQPELLAKVCRQARSYYEDLGRRAGERGDDVQARKYRLLANYYQLFAEPDKGYKRWLRAWETTHGERDGFSRQAELIRITDDAWESLATVPGAQVKILLLKGWLAYDLNDWRTAKESFYGILNKDPENEIELNLYLSVRKSKSTALVDGRRSPVEEAEANVGLGYVHFRRDALRTAARHFEKAIALVGQRFLKYEHAALIQAKALSGLGEVENRIGVPESILLRRFLLPEGERRTTLLEYEITGGQTEQLEDLALERLLKKAGDHYAEALRIIPDSDSATADRLRIEARQAHLYLELGAFQVARGLFESIRQRELERLSVSSERDILPGQAHQTADRLIWINLYLGDCYMLSPETPIKEEQGPVAWAPATEAPDLSQVAQDLNKAAYLKGIVAIDSANLEVGGQSRKPLANDFYGSAWNLSKKLNIREGMALSLRRQGDMAAMNHKDPQRRDRALHLYTKSLELIEQIGRPGEIARAQERIELLRARVASFADKREGEGHLILEKMARTKKGKRREKSVDDFLEQVDAYLAFRRRFFRYRVARKLAVRLRRSYRLVTAFIGFLIGILGVLLLVNQASWLIDVSDRVTGLSWALPALIVTFVVVFATLLADQYTWIRRGVVNNLPLRWFWLSQDQLAVDEVGLHLYDHTGQRKRLIRWPEVWEIRSEFWGEYSYPDSRAGSLKEAKKMEEAQAKDDEPSPEVSATGKGASQQEPEGKEETELLDSIVFSFEDGDGLFDESYAIENKKSEFLGECGVERRTISLDSRPEPVTVFELWLFDRFDSRTVSKIIVSEHDYNNEEIKSRLARLGDPIVARSEAQLTLETEKLILEATLSKLTYRAGELPPESAIHRLDISANVFRKTAPGSRRQRRSAPAKGSRTAVFGIAGPADEKLAAIRFDHQLRGYDRLLESVRAQVEARRWIEPKKSFITPNADFLDDTGLLLTSAGLLALAVFLTCPLTLIFALIRPITQFGPPIFAVVAGFVAFMSLLLIVFWYRARRHMHPRRLASPPPVVVTEKKGYR